jgi:hypothetical protein
LRFHPEWPPSHAVSRNSEITESEVFDLHISAGAFQCPGDRVLVDPLSIVARENKSVDVPDF